MSIRVGVIGVGYLGKYHAKILSEAKDAELVAVADIISSRAEEIALTYNCKPFLDYRELLDTVDAASIATPTTTHKEIAIECLKAEKHIFLEKPIAVNLEEADMLLDESKRKGLILQVGLLERYNPGFVKLASFINKPAFIESERISPFLGRGIDVDITLDLMIHDIDIILSLIPSKIKYINATGTIILSSSIDAAKAWIEFENGVSALITSSRLSTDKRRIMKVYQRDCFMILDLQSQQIKRYFKDDSGISNETIRIEQKEPLREELKDFIGCVNDKRQPIVTGEDGRNALKLSLMISDIVIEKLKRSGQK